MLVSGEVTGTVTLKDGSTATVVERLRLYPEWTCEWLLTLEDGRTVQAVYYGKGEYQEF